MRFSAHYTCTSIVFTEYSGLYNDLYDLYNEQQYTVHCLVAMMSCILRLECKYITRTLNSGKILCEPRMALVNSICASTTRAMALARAR